jgi:PKD repeat protein
MVGWDTALALDSAGNPRISYFDDTNDDLKYAWKDGAGWHLETVDAAGKVGQFTSLALDGAGNPRISYHDRANGDLKFARTASPPTPQEENVVPGATGPPADTDGDGLYDDLNGNGRMDFSDVLVLFEQREWIAAHGPVERFDYNANGLIDFADVVCFFNALGAPGAPPITAAFSMDRANGTAPLEVRFTSTSTGPFDALAWTVASGQAPLAAMNGTDPTFTFQAPGAYAVTLTARNTTTNRSAAVTQPVTVTAPAGPNLPFPGPHVLPGRIEAEDYDVAVSTPAYADTTTINEGGAYRFDAVDIEVLNRNYNIGWIRRGEYLNYSVDSAGGAFALTLNVANAVKKTEPVRIYLDGVPAGEVWIGLTADWVTFREFAASAPITVPEGRHVVTVSFESVERMNMDWLSLTAIDPAPDVAAVPYPGPHVLPATIEAEHFDAGGEGAAYHDTEPANLGAYQIRPGEGVDIETAGGVTDVCFVRAGEYLNYSVDMPAAGNLTLSLRAANPDPVAKPIAVALDGVPAGVVAIGPTGGWVTDREFAASAPLAIPAGRHVVTLAFDGVERINLDWLDLATEVPVPAITVTPTPTVTAIPGQEYTLAVAGLDLVEERVLIRNTGLAGVDLQGCTLSNRGSTRVYTFPAVVLGPGATLTVHTWSGADTGTDLHWNLGSEVWHDLGDTATLRAPDGSFISALARQTLP